MQRYIDVDKLTAEMQKIADAHNDTNPWLQTFAHAEREGFLAAMKMVKNAPTADVVPVVWCAQCRYCCLRPVSHERFCEVTGLPIVTWDFYCAHGERKDGGKDDG